MNWFARVTRTGVAGRVGFLVVMSSLIVGSLAGAGMADDDYVAEIEQWRDGRLGRLTAPDGYLSLTGLYWLEDGTHTFGGAQANALIFPGTDVPAQIGVFEVTGDSVTVRVRPDADVRCDGERVTERRLYHDHDSQHSRTLLELGDLSWYVIKRGDRVAVRLIDPNSPARRGFKQIESFPIDAQWRITGSFEPYRPVKLLPIVSEWDIETKEPSPGAIVFERGGVQHRLDVLATTWTEQYWVIFADETSAVDTYGAGRYVYVDPPAEDGTIVIDFNKAYNPPCAFSHYTTCALPPPQNRLAIRVEAGEKAYHLE